MKKSILILFIAAGTYMAQSCNSNNRSADDTVEYAEQQNEEMQEGANFMEFDNSEFAVEAANGGLTEVRASTIAQEKAQNQRVKDFAAMIIEDHTKANEELISLAANKNITLPTAPGEDKQQQIADLNSESDAEFDQAYMDMMVNDHQNDIDLFEDAAENSEDAEIRAFAEKTLPVLKKHLEEAESIQNSLE